MYKIVKFKIVSTVAGELHETDDIACASEIVERMLANGEEFSVSYDTEWEEESDD